MAIQDKGSGPEGQAKATQGGTPGGVGASGIPGDLGKVDTMPARPAPQGPLPPGYVRRPAAPGWVQWLLILAILAATGLIAWGVGRLQHGGVGGLLGGVVPVPEPRTELVEARRDRILMLERIGRLSRVLVKVAKQPGWLLVSEDDTETSRPALDPEGGHVAYVSQRGGGQIAIVGLAGDWRTTIEADEIAKADGAADMEGRLELCPWTQVAWAPGGERVAFFARLPDKGGSVVLVGTALDDDHALFVVKDSRAVTEVERQVAWVDDSHLMVSTPAEGASRAATVVIVQAPAPAK